MPATDGPPSPQTPPSASPPQAGPPVAPPAAPPATFGQLSQASPPGMPAASGGVYLDPASGLMLPQGTALAGVGRRIGAYFLGIPLFIVTLGIGYIIWGLIAWGRGQTPTYQLLGMRCWVPDSRRVPGWWRMALREVIGRIVEGILGVITGMVSFILFLATNEHRTLHDMVAGTVVLHDPNKVLG